MYLLHWMTAHDPKQSSVENSTQDYDGHYHLDDRLLEVLTSERSKGKDQAIVIQNLLEYFEITEDIVGICSDTTASNPGRLNGVIILLS